ncbi:hypothetical protein DRN69_03905 [Candidatus Pacearchaeota archaeon]|nr:MAG: hypothetical protein DRN69_03905 [Candidatus Pacearchaeota archaeon]
MFEVKEFLKLVILLIVLGTNIYIFNIYIIQDECCSICQVPNEKCLEEMRFSFLFLCVIDFLTILGVSKS